MLEQLQLFQEPKFDESIIREETRIYHPFVKSFGNNDEIEITIYQQDALLLMHKAALSIEGTLKRTAGTGTVEFTNNSGGYLFDSISYELNGKELDKARDLGTVSLIRSYICYDSDDKEHSIAGWYYPSGQLVTYDPIKSTFNLRIPLSHFLGIFRDYKRVVFGKQTIRLVRARTDVNCFKVDKDDTVAEITINNIELKVKHIFLNDVEKLNLLSQINNDKLIKFPYRQWEYHELPALTAGAMKEIWSVKTCPSVESPRYVIVAFQTNRKDRKIEDITLFDNINICNIKLCINSEYYPYEDMKLDFKSRKYSDIFYEYTQFAKFLSPTNKPILDFVAFNNHALFVIDCSKRDETSKNSTVDVKLEIESSEPFPANTRACCIIIHDRIMEYFSLSGIVRNSVW